MADDTELGNLFSCHCSCSQNQDEFSFGKLFHLEPSSLQSIYANI